MKKQRYHLLTAATIIGLTLLSGAVDGRLSGRWQSLKQLENAGLALQQLPAEIGAWRLQHEEELSSYAADVLQCTGYINRVYRHEQTGATVSVAIIVGPQGPMSVHTPEICYSSRDYEIQGEREHIAVNQHQFWRSTFQPVQTGSNLLYVYYGWNDGDGWSAPSQPRFAFAGRPYLYKLQLASTQSDEVTGDVSQMFLKDVLPVLNGCLLASSTKNPSSQ